jgi:hypothetical protein
MHQHVPVLPLVPHSNAVPQRAQARRRRGSPCAVGVVIVSLLGIIVCEINHPLVTALRQMQSGRLIHALPSLAPGMAATPFNAYDKYSIFSEPEGTR